MATVVNRPQGPNFFDALQQGLIRNAQQRQAEAERKAIADRLAAQLTFEREREQRLGRQGDADLELRKILGMGHLGVAQGGLGLQREQFGYAKEQAPLQALAGLLKGNPNAEAILKGMTPEQLSKLSQTLGGLSAGGLQQAFQPQPQTMNVPAGTGIYERSPAGAYQQKVAPTFAPSAASGTGIQSKWIEKSDGTVQYMAVDPMTGKTSVIDVSKMTPKERQRAQQNINSQTGQKLMLQEVDDYMRSKLNLSPSNKTDMWGLFQAIIRGQTPEGVQLPDDFSLETFTADIEAIQKKWMSAIKIMDNFSQMEVREELEGAGQKGSRDGENTVLRPGSSAPGGDSGSAKFTDEQLIEILSGGGK